ncbi:hypothetical protein GCM10022267_07990 [Lentzea roselyniae]|uniref:Uncharacterized protein n=1 Tax=Lentzea roselyniae TaxID=531940 RepID=A0ABP7A3K5_9PSEU
MWTIFTGTLLVADGADAQSAMVIGDSTVVLSPIATSVSLAPEQARFADGADAAAAGTIIAAATTVASAVESRGLLLRTVGLLRRVRRVWRT